MSDGLLNKECKTLLTDQVIVVLHIGRAAVQRLPLDAQDGVDLLRVHVVGACGQSVPEGLMGVRGDVVAPPSIWPTATHLRGEPCKLMQSYRRSNADSAEPIHVIVYFGMCADTQCCWFSQAVYCNWGLAAFAYICGIGFASDCGSRAYADKQLAAKQADTCLRTAEQGVHLAYVPCEVSAGTWHQAWAQWDPSWAYGDPGGVQQGAAAASWPAALACVPAAPFVWQPEREPPSEHIGALEAEAAWQRARLVQRTLWILVACPLALQQPQCSLEEACSSALLLLLHHTTNSSSFKQAQKH